VNWRTSPALFHTSFNTVLTRFACRSAVRVGPQGVGSWRAKLLLTTDVGDRRLAMAQCAVHQIVQLMGEAGDEGLTAAEQFYTLAV
jgi:hypothetical protein